MRKLGNSMFMPIVGAVRRVVSSRLAIAGLAVAVTAAVVGGVAAASIPDDGSVIHGCYNQVNGGLRVVDPRATCKPGEVALPWNQTGPQGPAGPPGPAGVPAQTGVAVTQVIPPPADPDTAPSIPVTLHLTTGTWHVTGETKGAPLQNPSCRFSTTTGTVLGDVINDGAGRRSDLLVDVRAARATVTMLCLGDLVVGSTYSENIFAVPVVMQQP